MKQLSVSNLMVSRAYILHQFLWWIYSWVTLLEGLVGVITLGYIKPSWSFTFILWMTSYDYKKDK